MGTNRLAMLDLALTKPSRLDRNVEFSMPDLEGMTIISRATTVVGAWRRTLDTSC